MKLKLFITITDGQDGSYTISAFPTKELALADLDRTEEQLQEGSVYEDGVMIEKDLEIGKSGGEFILLESFHVSTDKQ